MLSIYNLHQVVTQKDSSRLTQRNCLDYYEFDQFLSSGFIRFDKLKDVMRRREGIGLTIDDATVGAYDAALLCAAHKQHVTVFLNPYYVETGRQYHMQYLSRMLEEIEHASFCFNGQTYDLSKPRQRKQCRKAIKDILCTFPSEDECIDYLEHLFGKKVSSVQLPYQVRTMTRKQLDTLIDNKYVAIGYHGWTHTSPSSMSISQVLDELELGRAWFRKELQQDIGIFALPFGKRVPLLEKIPDFPLIFLEDGKYDHSIVKHRVINRFPFESLLESWRDEMRDLEQITNPVYSPDGSVLIRYPVSTHEDSFSIPDSVTVIGSGAFNNCKAIRHIVIPESVQVIRRNAFAHCSLESVYIPDSVEEIGDLCFYGCNKMRTIRLSHCIKDLGDAVFSGCSSLEIVVLPMSLEKIGDGMFMGCTSLKTVYLPHHAKPLRKSMFIDCPNFHEIIIY